MILVALIEDNRLVREGIAALLNRTEDIRVVAGGASGDLDALKRARPHVLLLDLGLRNGDSLRVTQRIRRELPDARVIVMDLLPAHEELVDFVNAGVSGFIMKDATLDDLVHALVEQHRPLVCGANLAMAQGIVDVSGTGASAQELTVALCARRVAVYPGDRVEDGARVEPRSRRRFREVQGHPNHLKTRARFPAKTPPRS